MIFDLHCDTLLKIYRDDTSLRRNAYHLDIEKMLAGPSTAQFFAMYVDLAGTQDAFKTCNEMIDKFEEEISSNPEIAQARDYDMLVDHQSKGLMSGVVTIEEGGVLQGNLANVKHFFDRGCRAITLTWNYENELGYPNMLFPDKGLKPFGIEVVKEMNRLGILIDVSHLSDAGFYDCIKHSKDPIIASHSNARSVCNHFRNLTDDMILALKANGGVMGMNYCSFFLDGSQVSKVASIIEHISYIKDLAGLEVIALGSDFDGIGGELEIKDMGSVHLLKEGLEAKGFTADEIDMIFYKNAMRVFKQVTEK